MRHNLSVLMFPWVAHGHVSPFLELAKKLIASNRINFHIYFCSTLAILNSIKLPEKYSDLIQLIELHLPSSPELPPHYHTTKGLSPHLMLDLKRAFDMASLAFFDILKTLNPSFLIYDFIPPWAPAQASSLNIPSVHFIVASTTSSAFLFHAIEKKPSSCDDDDDDRFPFSEIFLHPYMKPNFYRLVESSATGVKEKDRGFQCFRSSCNIILVKSFREIEGKFIDYLSLWTQKKLVPVGPLVQEPAKENHDDRGIDIIQWLDKKERSSTVFVSFGSEYFLSKEEMEDVALGLDLSGVNFIWVVRYPNSNKVTINVKVAEELPNNFRERTQERGMVVEGWAPQMKILGHPSIGGFVSHCGWSSIMESLKLGVPIIAVPMHLDQPFNARLVDDVGVGVEVRRNCNNWRIEREELARMTQEVVSGKGIGEKVRRKASQMSEIIRNKGDEEIDVVVDELIQLCG